MTFHQTLRRQRIAVVGAGISGLGAAWALSRHHDVTVFEAAARPGGHSNTVEVDYDGAPIAVDTGFIVFNNRNYPNLQALFAQLNVPSVKSDMSFSVSVGDADRPGRLEWSGDNLRTLFAQKRNLFNLRFHRMWLDILRFNPSAASDLDSGRLAGSSLGEYLTRQRYGDGFMLDYLLPMGAAIWSTPLAGMMEFPAETFVRFFNNHGLLSVGDRPQWYTVRGGSREYVRRVIADMTAVLRLSRPVRAVRRHSSGVTVLLDGEAQPFDHVVLACHADQALALLGDQATAAERDLLSCFRFQQNRAVLHRDPAQMPRRRQVWASWNYLSEPRRDLQRRVGLTYWMNRLQAIDHRYPLFVTLNPVREPAAGSVFAEFSYEHPLFDRAAIAAQARLDEVQGRDRLWFCGAWCRYGFHEDGFTSALEVARRMGAPPVFAAAEHEAAG